MNAAPTPDAAKEVTARAVSGLVTLLKNVRNSVAHLLLVLDPAIRDPRIPEIKDWDDAAKTLPRCASDCQSADADLTMPCGWQERC